MRADVHVVTPDRVQDVDERAEAQRAAADRTPPPTLPSPASRAPRRVDAGIQRPSSASSGLHRLGLAGSASAAAGKAVFTGAGGCGSCHTLAAAGTTGTVGPNLTQRLKSDCATPASMKIRGKTLSQCIDTAITKPYAYLPIGLQRRDHAGDLRADARPDADPGTRHLPRERDKVSHSTCATIATSESDRK